MSLRFVLLKAGQLAASNRKLRHVLVRHIFRGPTTEVAERLAWLGTRISESQNKLRVIHELYPRVAAQVQTLEGTIPRNRSSPIDDTEHGTTLLSILDILASSGHPEDVQFADVILKDMSRLFRLTPNIDTHTAIIRGLIRGGNTDNLLNWFRFMKLKPPYVFPTLEQFHIFLEGVAETVSLRFMQNVVLTMGKVQCTPTNETFRILIRAAWSAAPEDKPPHPIVFETLMDNMKTLGMPYDPSMATFFHEGYALCGLMDHADRVREAYMSRFESLLTHREQLDFEWSRKIPEAVRSRDHTQSSTRVAAALEITEQFKEAGGTPSSAILTAVLRYAELIEELHLAQKSIGVTANAQHWSLLLMNNAIQSKRRYAMEIYEASKRAGIVPVIELVGPLIRLLCRNGDQPPPRSYLDDALAIYRDFVAAAPPLSVGDRTGYRHSLQPERDMYRALFAGLSLSQNDGKYIPIAKALFDDMQLRGVHVSEVAHDMIIMLIKQASNLNEAFDSYRGLRSTLGRKGYSKVLEAFGRLLFSSEQAEVGLPALDMYFKVVEDMKAAGHPIDTTVYIILLNQIADLSSLPRFGGNSLDDLVKVLRRIHDLITIDASISPDAQLWNHLMSTYQRLGCFGDALRVWDLMYLAGRYDTSSIDIILSGCQDVRSWNASQVIGERLLRDKVNLSQVGWHIILESLCRQGKLDSAVKAVCLQMGREEQALATPNAETVQLLMKYAQLYRLEEAVIERLKQYLPDLWRTLSSNYGQ